jgi:superfamily II DNA or RNA helicase
MQDSGQLLGYLQQGIDTLLKQEGFDGGQEFRRTQKQAIEAYKRYLNNDNYTTAEKLKGFFEIPTGVGKTAVFIGIVSAAHKAAEENGEELKTAIVVPTVQLLEQTVESLEDFAPWMKDSIGIYGDGKKNLKLPFTVLTYDAFVDLMEAGKLSSENIDILISDEAHRGTSERRVDNIKDAFNENTVQLAFTATAHFDDEKSVLNSHEREIFYKSVADAIREGELAAYVSSQRYIIRVDPDEFMLTKEFQKASDERKITYRRAAKQNAWNKRMVKIFRDGRDEKTGDLLTDNQAGFFVEGTRQADKLEDLLNGDIEIIKRAEEQGYEGVAVAIHSKLSKKEQKRRYKAYKAGKYMAVIGDEMFKEGFDHPPMKTLFDCPHSSVVDKAQILGRGLRKWWNELKDRYEGLTIIDTVMYFGDEDKDIQEKNRDRALMNTISVKQVLEGSYIASDDYFDEFDKTPKAGGRSSGGGGSLFDDDPDVEEYTSLEDLYELEEQISRLRKEHWVDLTDAMYKNLIDSYARTQVGSTTIVKMDGAPDHLEDYHINHWKSGNAKVVDSELWEWVISQYESLPDGEQRVSISQDYLDLIRKHKNRTKVAEAKLFLNAGDIPEGLTSGIVGTWLSGNAVTATQTHLDYVLKIWNDTLGVILVTQSMIDIFEAEIKRTGVGSYSILKDLENIPEELTVNVIHHKLTNAESHIREDHLKFITDNWKKLPTVVNLEQETIDLLKAEAIRTGMGPERILGQMPDAPEGLNPNIIRSWVNKSTKTARKDWITAVCGKYKGLPDQSFEVEAVSDDDYQSLVSLKKQTGIGPISLFAKRSDKPDGFNASLISNWFRKQPLSARKDYFEYAVKVYQDCLDSGEYKIKITDETKDKLKRYQEKTGIAPVSVLKGREDVPASLTPGRAKHWISGAAEFAIKNHLDYIFKAYEDCGLRAITSRTLSNLTKEIERTGVNPNSVLNDAVDVPSGVNKGKVASWISGSSSRAQASELAYVLRRYRQFPNDPYIDMSDEDHMTLQQYKKQTGIGAHAFIGKFNNPPEGLTAAMLDRWIRKKPERVREDHLKFVVSGYSTLLVEMKNKPPSNTPS